MQFRYKNSRDYRCTSMPLCCNFSLCVIHNAEETIINQEQFILSGAENLLVKVSHDVVAFEERINLLS